MKKKIILLSILLFVCVTFLLISNTNKNEVISSNINNNIDGLAFYVQSEEGSEEYTSADTIPSKNDGYIFKEAVCNDNTTVTFNDYTWSLNVSNMENGRVRCKLYFDIDDAIARKYILSQNTVNEGTPDFSESATTNEGIFTAEDDYGTSYYYRGDVDNNYFYFAGYYWRIIRINGDGTLRLIYQGTSASSTGDDANIFSSSWTDNQNDNAYVGYMYGSSGASTYSETHSNTNSSIMKNNLENWYDENLVTYEEYIADTGFCGDRSLTSGTGIGTSTTYYGAYGRLVNSKEPSLKCTNENDLYTTGNSNIGNKSLTNPIGLITADEVSMAGGVSSGTSGTSNTSYYLYTGSNYKIMSPYGYFNDGGTTRAVLFGVDTTGVLRRFSNTTSAHGARPVINIKKDVELEGNGTSNAPYKIKGLESAKDIILANKTVNTRTDFSIALTSNTTKTIYSTIDDDGITYYFAGNPDDNWVQFAGYYWRIVRINGDETIRLIYNGKTNTTTGTETMISNTQVFNIDSSDNAYIGYMYGTVGANSYSETHTNKNNSAIKEFLDSWYYENLSSYEEYIADSGFCGDRSIVSGTGTGTTSTTYGAYNRLRTNKEPTLKCANKNDLYTTSTSSKGNGSLIYPIGLITADEVAYAGGLYYYGGQVQNHYLYNGQYYWTMTPSYLYTSNNNSTFSYIFMVNNGSIDDDFGLNQGIGVRPVINLRVDISLSGSGTASDPYIVN